MIAGPSFAPFLQQITAAGGRLGIIFATFRHTLPQGRVFHPPFPYRPASFPYMQEALPTDEQDDCTPR